MNREKKKETLEEVEMRLRHLDDVYYNHADPCGIVTSDEEYDALRTRYEAMTGEKDKTIGAPVISTKRTAKLPFFMGSLDKIKDGEEARLERWKGDCARFIVQPKLDGVSALYYQDRLYTRGDGSMGSDISYILPYLNNLPGMDVPCVRGEIVMPSAVFSSKYASLFKNNRNLVSGILNSKTPDPAIARDLVLVPYEVRDDQGSRMAPSQQLDYMNRVMGFAEVISSFSVTSSSQLSIGMLNQLWESFTSTTRYPTDGIVIWKDEAYTPKENGNPDYAIAFKKIKQTAITRVVRVHWNPSKYNVLKPRIEIEPVDLSGTRITFVTGFNAKYIRDFCIGKGAELEVTRSGDVIPHILAVHRPSDSGTPELPFPSSSFQWNESGVDILGVENSTTTIKKIHYFFKTLGIKTLAEKTIAKLVLACSDVDRNAAVSSTTATVSCLIARILSLTSEQMMIKAGLGPLESKKLWSQIHEHGRLENIPLPLLMTASGVFGQGYGLRKIEPIAGLVHLGEERIAQVPGWTRESASRFLKGMPAFHEFLKECEGLVRVASASSATSAAGAMAGEKNGVVFSGFRDKSLEKILVEKGYVIQDTVTLSGTVCVLVRDGDGEGVQETVKIKKAREKGIHVRTVEQIMAELDQEKKK